MTLQSTSRSRRQDFWAYETSQRVPELLSLDINSKATGTVLTDTRLITGIGSPVPTRFNSFESSANSGVAPAQPFLVSPTLTANVAAAVASVPLLWSMNATQVISRDGTLTCGGCHRGSANASIAPSQSPGGNGDIRFPSSNDFVHIQEDGNISPYMRDRALPQRAEILNDFNASGGIVSQMRLTAQKAVSPSVAAAAAISAPTIPTALDPQQLDAFRDQFRGRGRAFGVMSVH